MKVGTKSLLFGVHCFLIHPIIVLIAWIKLYGFPFDPRIWIAIFVHDWGYWGCDNMDGKEGKNHPELGGRIMDRLFGKKWGDFTRFHSKSYADQKRRIISKLCVADKLSIALELYPIYIFRAKLSGELREYMENWKESDSKEWYKRIQKEQREWVDRYKYYPINPIAHGFASLAIANFTMLMSLCELKEAIREYREEVKMMSENDMINRLINNAQ